MRKLENKELDEIGRALVKADVIPVREIDRIVANKALFDGVLARIEDLELQAPGRRRFTIGFKPAAFAAIALMAASALAFVAFKSRSTETIAKKPSPETPKTLPSKRFTEPDRVVETKLPPPPAQERAERISTKSIQSSSVPRKQPESRRASHEGDFYALSYAGDPNETERGGRIVRVDVPKSTLFAMGVDIPLENEADTVKADLLIGNDGVTLAIRIVK